MLRVFLILSLIYNTHLLVVKKGFCLESHDKCISLEGGKPTRNILLDIFVHTDLKYVPQNWRPVTQLGYVHVDSFVKIISINPTKNF
jgi:hypothetical protein